MVVTAQLFFLLVSSDARETKPGMANAKKTLTANKEIFGIINRTNIFKARTVLLWQFGNMGIGL